MSYLFQSISVNAQASINRGSIERECRVPNRLTTPVELEVVPKNIAFSQNNLCHSNHPDPTDSILTNNTILIFAHHKQVNSRTTNFNKDGLKLNKKKNKYN